VLRGRATAFCGYHAALYSVAMSPLPDRSPSRQPGRRGAGSDATTATTGSRLARWTMRWTLVAAAAVATTALDSHDAVAQLGAQASARPWLGIAMDPPDGQAGVHVGHVIRGSPADKAGVHEGDRVLRVGGTDVARGAEVSREVGRRSVGDAVDLALSRSGQPRTARVTLAPFPPQDDMMRMDLVGAFAPTWKDVQTVSGTFPASVGSMRGHVVLLDFWATWCGPCRVVIPKLDALQARFGAQGLSVLGVSTEEASQVALFTQRMPMHYGVGVDVHGKTTRSYGVGSLPTLVIIDKRGVVRDVAIGYDPGEDVRLEATVRTLLAEPAPIP
ncbi:MAG: redoxin domain-containing protein, partial [Polyangiaceae bacterium]